jgi:genome maintenance exonuclease 1
MTIHSSALYNGTLRLDFDDAEHVYTIHEDGKAPLMVPGVTSILAVINKPALVPWAAKLTAETYTGLVSAAVDSGTLNPKRLLEIEKEAKGAPRAKAKAGADIGTLVHAWAEAWARGQPLPMPEDDSARKGVEAFTAWCEAHHVRFRLTEMRVYSRAFNYAGTFDFMAEVDGELMLGDYKVSSGIYPEHHLQCAAYAQAYGEATGETVRDRIVVCFDKTTGKFQHERRNGTNQYVNDLNGFLGAKQLHHALAALK